MTGLKTKPTDASVEAFLRGIPDPEPREDSMALLRLMKKVTGAAPKMWGRSIVGFGSYHYRYASGHEGDWFVTGFAPRKGTLTIYIVPGFDRSRGLLRKLGRFKRGKSCLYVKRLEDIDLAVLEELVRESVSRLAALRRRLKRS